MSDSPDKGVEGPYRGSLARHLTRVAVLMGMIAAVVGAGHLAAWLGGYMLQRGLSTITMKTNTALCLTLVGVALMLLVTERAGPVRRWTARICAVVALSVGLLTFVENLSGWDFGIDQLLAVETPGALAVSGPNRMGTPASLSYTLIGLALLILGRRDRRGVWEMQALALVVCLIALLPTIGFLYGAQQFYGIVQYTGIAWPTALALLLMGLGLLCARPAEGLMAQVTANDPGGVSLRRLLPAFVILPLLLGWLRLIGERVGLFDAAMGTGVMMLLFIVIFSVLTYYVSRAASHSAKTLRESEQRLALAASGTQIGMYEWNVATGKTLWTEQVMRLLGLRSTTTTTTTTTTTFSQQYHYHDWTERVHPEDLPRVEAELHRCMAERTPYETEYRVVWPDGSVHWIADRGVLQYGSDGQCTGMLGINMDITERKQAEAAISQSQRTFAELIERSPFGTYVVDSQFRIALMNASSQDGAFRNMRPVIGRDLGEAMRILWPQDIAAEIIGHFRHTLDTGESYYSPRFVNPRRDVETVEAYEWELHRMTLPDGQYGVICYYYDSTKLRDAEAAVRESEERLRSLAENVPCVLMRFDRQLRIAYLSPQSERYNAIPVEHLLGRTNREVGMPEELCDFWDAAIERVFRAGTQEEMEFDLAGPSGMRTFELKFAPEFGPDHEVRYVLGVSSDITERKRAEQGLQESEERFRALVTASSEVLYRMSPDWSEMRRLDSRGFLANTERLNPTWLEEYIPPDDQPHVTAAIQEAIRTKGVFELEHRVRRADGSLGWTFSRAVPLLGANGEIVEWFGSASDITEQKQAEEALRESEAQFRALFENMEDGFAYCRMVFDDEGRPVDFICLNVNSAFGRLTGLENVVGKRVTEVLPGIREIHPELLETYARVVRTGRPERLEIEFKPLAMWLTIAVYNPQPGHFAAVFDNITERKRAEEALRELNATLESKIAQRTAQLQHRAGQLQKLALELSQAEERERRRVAVILHEDLQQQIAGARFHLTLVRNRTRDDRQRAEVDKINAMLTATIEASRSLSHDLSPSVLHMNDLAEALGWLVNRVRAQHGLTAHLEVKGQMILPSEALAIFLFRAAQEMLFNVVKHAHVKEAAVGVRRIGRYVCLTVADQGRGFDPQELNETSGIGLFSIRERVESLGGRLRIKSVAGKGSRIRIVVPGGTEDGKMMRTEQGRGLSLSHVPASLPSARRDGALRVLLVDDHEIVRQGLGALLQELPDIVVVGEAADGCEAVDMAGKLRPDVVIMDVSMPRLSGEEATRQIKMYLPETRVIALSMYHEPDKMDTMYKAGAEGYILKTAGSEELLAAVRGNEFDS